MRNSFLLLYFIFIPFVVFSSIPEIDKLLEKAKKYQEAEKFDRSLKLFQEAEVLVLKDSSYSAKELFQIYRGIGGCYTEKKVFDRASEFYKKVESVVKNNNEIDTIMKASLLSSYADLYSAKQEYEKAAEYYFKYCKKIELVYKDDEKLLKSYIYSNVKGGTCLLRVGRMKEAIDIFTALKPAFPADKFLDLKYMMLSNLGFCYEELGEIDKAIIQFEKCESINDKLKIKETSAANNLGFIYYIAMEDSKKAKYYFKKVLNIIDSDPKANKDMYCYAANNISAIYFDQKQYDKAYKYIDIALKSAIKAHGLQFPFTNQILSQKGRILMLKGKIQEAEKLFDEANENLSIDINNRKTFEDISFTGKLHNVILQQSKAYLELYQRTGELKVLEKSNYLSDLNIVILDKGRSLLTDADSKAALNNSARDFYHLKVKILEFLYLETEDKKYINNALELFEKTNNFTLLESVLKSNDSHHMGLPQEIFDEENNLKTRLAEAESNLFQKQSDSLLDTIQMLEFEKKVDDCKSKYREFIADLKKNHSRYFKLNYSDEVVTLDELQNNFLEEDQTLIHYYLSEDEIHCIAITENEVGFYLIDNKENVIESVHQLREGIIKAHKDRDSSSGLPEMNDASFDLYHALIRPIKIPLKNKLIIVPMGELSYIPFEILLKSTPIKHAEFYDYQFLLKDHAISYGYSSTLLYDAKAKTDEKKVAKFVGFGPSFNSRKIASNRSELVSLSYNKKEVRSIKEIAGGDIFLDDEASKEKFVEICGAYQILHLATHGVSNSDDGENSYLAFSENEVDSNSSLLYARDIYNLDLDTELVVLSACETAIGELQDGEGVISLSRAFTYAGARSNITTLWQVNDGAASILMQNFYKELKLGASKDEALRKAKLNYIAKSANEHSHPFYWSAFIPTGDMEAIKMPVPSNFSQYILFGLIGITLLLLGTYVYKSRFRTLSN